MNKRVYPLLILILLATLGVKLFYTREPAGGFAPAVTARVDAAAISEMSGLVKSRSYPDLFWAHNDSGDTARIFAVNGEGRTIIPTYSRFSFYGEAAEEGKQPWQGFRVLNAENVDWEDIAADDNYLYMADTGNNFNNRRDLGIYLLSEIDATASTQSAAIRHIPVHYPEQEAYPGTGDWHFDSESLFVDAGTLYLITKHRPRGRPDTMEPGANLYRLDTQDPDRANPLTLIDHHPALTAATGADLSPNGQTLAVVSYTALWLFDRPAAGDAWLSSGARRVPLDTAVLRQVEAVAWDGDETLLLGNEQRDLFRIELATLPVVPREQTRTGMIRIKSN